MKFKSVFLLLFFLSGVQLHAQTAEKLKYEAYIQKDHTKWLKAAQYIEKNTDVSKTENLLELIHCYYAYTSALIAKRMRNDAAESIQKGESLVNSLLKKEPNNALALNYRADFLGYEIALNKFKAFSVGKACMDNYKRAYELAPNDIQILFDKANSLYYPPKMFGGNKKEALKYIQKAISILEKQNKTRNNWIYLQLLVLEGHSYELLGNDPSAEKSYLKILKIEPNFLTVRDDLYPKLKKRMDGISNEKPEEKDYSFDSKNQK